MQLTLLRQILCGITLFFASLAATAEPLSLEAAAKTQGTVLMIRHALAPGFGDPSNFNVAKCETQRNLDSNGRRQAVAMGDAMRRAGFQSQPVLSSPWCRCLETAELMAMGPVEAFDGLASFFQSHAPRGATLRKLRTHLQGIRPTDRPQIMVTHQVVISAITGLGTRSGGAVLFDPSTGKSFRVEMPPTP